MTGPRFFFSDIVFASTTKTMPCVLPGRRAVFFSGGGADTRIVNEPVLPAAILLRPKQGKHIHRLHAAGLARGRNLFAGVIYA